MTSDVLYAGLFGVFATLAGVLATHALSFSRDRHVRQDDQRALYGAMASELRTIEQGFRTAVTHIPRFQSASVFSLRGGTLAAPLDLSLRLANLVFVLERVADITREHTAFSVAVASSGNPNLEWSDWGSVAERSELVKQALAEVPKLVSELERLAREGRA